MKLRNLNKDYPNYQMEVLEILYGKGAVVGKYPTKKYTVEQYDLLVENKAQGLIERRLKAVIDRTPQYALPFAQTEIRNINDLFTNSISKTVGNAFRGKMGISSGTDLTSTSWEVGGISRYKEYLEAFVQDGCTLEEDLPEPDQAEVTFKEIFASFDNLIHNFVVEYRHYTRANSNDKWGDYEIISVADCNSLRLFQNRIANCINDVIAKLTKKLKKRGNDKMQLIVSVKQSTYRYNDLIADELFTNAKFSGNMGWQLAFEESRQDAILNKIMDFSKAWDIGILELRQKLLLVEFGLQNEKFTPNVQETNLSFAYISDDKENEITNMYESLKGNLFLHDETTKSIFRTIFVSKPVKDKVVWIGGINTLSYFIKQLAKKGKIDKKVDYWKITKLCFSIDGSSMTTVQLKQAKKPATPKAKTIDRLVGNL